MPTLLDGREVPADSEEWRHECEARAILALKDKEDRRRWLAIVETRRGAKAADRLRETMTALWRIRDKQP